MKACKLVHRLIPTSFGLLLRYTYSRMVSKDLRYISIGELPEALHYSSFSCESQLSTRLLDGMLHQLMLSKTFAGAPSGLEFYSHEPFPWSLLTNLGFINQPSYILQSRLSNSKLIHIDFQNSPQPRNHIIKPLHSRVSHCPYSLLNTPEFYLLAN